MRRLCEWGRVRIWMRRRWSCTRIWWILKKRVRKLKSAKCQWLIFSSRFLMKNWKVKEYLMSFSKSFWRLLRRNTKRLTHTLQTQNSISIKTTKECVYPCTNPGPPSSSSDSSDSKVENGLTNGEVPFGSTPPAKSQMYPRSKKSKRCTNFSTNPSVKADRNSLRATLPPHYSAESTSLISLATLSTKNVSPILSENPVLPLFILLFETLKHWWSLLKCLVSLISTSLRSMCTFLRRTGCDRSDTSGGRRDNTCFKALENSIFTLVVNLKSRKLLRPSLTFSSLKPLPRIRCSSAGCTRLRTVRMWLTRFETCVSATPESLIFKHRRIRTSWMWLSLCKSWRRLIRFCEKTCKKLGAILSKINLQLWKARLRAWRFRFINLWGQSCIFIRHLTQ